MTAARVGIGGPVGSGKTALIEAMLRELAEAGELLGTTRQNVYHYGRVGGTVMDGQMAKLVLESFATECHELGLGLAELQELV